MPINKVLYGGKKLIDITDSTVTEDLLAKGATAYDKAGNRITGTATFMHVAYATFTNCDASYDAASESIVAFESSDYVKMGVAYSGDTITFTKGSGSQIDISYDADSKTIVISNVSTSDFTTGDRSSQNHIGVYTDESPSPSTNIESYKWMKVS